MASDPRSRRNLWRTTRAISRTWLICFAPCCRPPPALTLNPSDGRVGAHDVVKVGSRVGLPAKAGLGGHRAIYSAAGSRASPAAVVATGAMSRASLVVALAGDSGLETSRSPLDRDQFGYAKRNSPT